MHEGPGVHPQTTVHANRGIVSELNHEFFMEPFDKQACGNKFLSSDRICAEPTPVCSWAARIQDNKV